MEECYKYRKTTHIWPMDDPLGTYSKASAANQ